MRCFRGTGVRGRSSASAESRALNRHYNREGGRVSLGGAHLRTATHRVCPAGAANFPRFARTSSCSMRLSPSICDQRPEARGSNSVGLGARAGSTSPGRGDHAGPSEAHTAQRRPRARWRPGDAVCKPSGGSGLELPRLETCILIARIEHAAWSFALQPATCKVSEYRAYNPWPPCKISIIAEKLSLLQAALASSTTASPRSMAPCCLVHAPQARCIRCCNRCVVRRRR